MHILLFPFCEPKVFYIHDFTVKSARKDYFKIAVVYKNNALSKVFIPVLELEKGKILCVWTPPFIPFNAN